MPVAGLIDALDEEAAKELLPDAVLDEDPLEELLEGLLRTRMPSRIPIPRSVTLPPGTASMMTLPSTIGRMKSAARTSNAPSGVRSKSPRNDPLSPISKTPSRHTAGLAAANEGTTAPLPSPGSTGR